MDNVIEYKGKEYQYHERKDIFREYESHPTVNEENFLSRLRNGWTVDDSLWTKKDNRGRKSKEEAKAEPTELTTRDRLLLRLKEVSSQGKFKQPKPVQSEEQDGVDSKAKEQPVSLSKPLEKRVTLYFARVLLDKEERAIVGFTTEQHISDLDLIESDILLLSKVSFKTAGSIQQEITEYFNGRVDEEKTKELSSSQCFNFEGDEFYEALDYIYLLIASY